MEINQNPESEEWMVSLKKGPITLYETLFPSKPVIVEPVEENAEDVGTGVSVSPS